jgi:hypothetical protein
MHFSRLIFKTSVQSRLFISVSWMKLPKLDKIHFPKAGVGCSNEVDGINEDCVYFQQY